MNKLIFGVLILFAFQACQSPTEQGESQTAEEKTTTTEETTFGDAVSEEQLMSYDDLVASLAEQDSVAATVKASVDEVCQVKGCWMNVSNESGEGEKLFVQFKDYGFFMPKDLSGGKVIMEGYAYRDVTSVDELRHYAEDEGKSPEEIAAITEPEEQLKFMASGVKIVE